MQPPTHSMDWLRLVLTLCAALHLACAAPSRALNEADSPEQLCTTSPQYPALALMQELPGNQRAWNPVTDLKSTNSTPWDYYFQIQAAQPGKWTALVAFTPFTVVPFYNLELKGAPPTASFAAAATDYKNKAYLQFFRPNSSAPAAGVEVAFTSVIRDLDPIVLTTSENGLVELSCINGYIAADLQVEVQDESVGCYEGRVRLSERGWGVVPLGRCL